MVDSIAHRGPDGEGIYAAGQVALGHRRLAIIDLNSGQQPLSNEDDSVWIVFNGEIYNYLSLRGELLGRGHSFKTKSDTEVIIHLYEEFGPACVERLRGMFAFAIWDARKSLLLLARDRVGIKPLYYRLSHQSLIFGSEIKAILADPEAEFEVQPEMIDRFLTFYYMPGQETLFRNVLKLEPGCYLTAQHSKVSITRYWDLDFSQSDRSIGQCSTELDSLFEECVDMHMISDVPVGFLLSGGVDSAAVLGYAVGKTDYPLSTYTLGFSGVSVADERGYAKLTADRYQSVHRDLTISSKDFQEFLPKYVWHMEEPVCEPPGIALYYVSKLASNHVKVLLAGEGGDEAFGGYQNYRSLLWLERLKSWSRPFNGALAAGLGFANKALHSDRLTKYGPLFNTPFESYYYSRTSGPLALFNSQMDSFYTSDFARLVDKNRSLQVVTEFMGNAAGYDQVNKMLYVDTKTWLPDDLLVKADKMTMANSVELRVPLLDHKLLEFAASMPGSYKVRGFTTKYIAKKVLEKRVPQEILNRRKTGFTIPYASWLRSDMKDWLFALLLDRQSVERGYFNRKAIEALLQENVRSGAYARELFSLAVLELWHQVFLPKGASGHLAGVPSPAQHTHRA